MERKITCDIVGIIGCVPLLWAIILLFTDGGLDNFNPWGNGYFDIWPIGLPLVIGTTICLVNSMVGLMNTWRTQIQH